MIKTELLIIGAGPAGLCAAREAGRAGIKTLILERSHVPGGQLVKQTHMFFGSEKQYASHRGLDIGDILLAELRAMPSVELVLNATVLSIYDDNTVTVDLDGRFEKVESEAIIVATGASEKSLPFPGNDLPGVCGAGAVQTLMNQYGVKPADDVVMIGAGNIGLIVSYQLMQAGVNVKCIVEGAPRIGGYLVHASKVRRMGVPILTSHSVKEAHGADKLEAVTIWKLDEKWQGVPGTEERIECDTLCVSVGLSPLGELLWQAGCKMIFVGALGGHVPLRDQNLATTVPHIFVAGDVTGVEEASAAMVEGTLAGLSATKYLGKQTPGFEERRQDALEQLASLRRGHAGDRLKSGIAAATIVKEA